LRLTDMIAVVPSRMVPNNSDLTIIPLPIKIPGFTKSMAWHERTHHDPAHQWIRALCFEINQHSTTVI
ncbi:LysR family transcriptional regulator, partial [Escherichia coli]